MYTILALDLDEQLQMEQKLPDELVARIYHSAVDADLAVLEKKMQTEYGDTMGIYRSQPFFLECVPPGIDKAHALDVLCRERGIKKEEIIACGDAWNDLSMIELPGKVI